MRLRLRLVSCDIGWSCKQLDHDHTHDEPLGVTLMGEKPKGRGVFELPKTVKFSALQKAKQRERESGGWGGDEATC